MTLIVLASCLDHDSNGSYGQNGPLGVDQAALVQCRTTPYGASYEPATNDANGHAVSFSAPASFAVPASVLATNPHAGSEVRLRFYPVAAADDICTYRCETQSGVCAGTVMHFSSCSSGRAPGDRVVVDSLKVSVQAWSAIPTGHGLISTSGTLEEAGPCQVQCDLATLDDDDPCTIDRCVVDAQGASAAVHTNTCDVALDAGVATTVGASLDVLVAEDVIVDFVPASVDVEQEAGIVGRVLDPNGAPAPGIKATLVGHPEYGWTETDANGEYVLFANGARRSRST